MTTKIKPSVLADTAVTPGSYGGSSQQAVFTVDQQGRLTYAGNATPSIATSQLTGTVNATQIANNQTYGVNITGSAGSAPASDVYSWAKASTKPSYTKSEVGLGNVDNTADVNKSVNYSNSTGAVAWGNVSSKPSLMRKIKTYTTGYLGDAPNMNDGGLPWASTGDSHQSVNFNFMFSNSSYSLSIPTPAVGGTQAFRAEFATSVWWGGTLAITTSWLGDDVLNLRYATAVRSGSNVVWNGYNASNDAYRIFCGNVVHSYNESAVRTTFIPLYIAFNRSVYHSYYGFYTPTTWPYALQLDFYGD